MDVDVEPWRDRRLPESMRAELRQPLGPILSGDAVLEAVRDVRRVVTVGDACTLDLIDRGRVPEISVVDFKTRREADEDLAVRIAAIPARTIRAVNPGATLTADVWRALDEAFKSAERVRIEVLGEEDLAALAAIALAPDGTAVLYGQPGEGVVFVRVDAQAKAAVRDLLERMV